MFTMKSKMFAKVHVQTPLIGVGGLPLNQDQAPKPTTKLKAPKRPEPAPSNVSAHQMKPTIRSMDRPKYLLSVALESGTGQYDPDIRICGTESALITDLEGIKRRETIGF